MSKLNLKTYWKTTKDNYTVNNKGIEANIDSLEKTRRERRETWVVLQQEYPEVTKTTLRKLALAIYAWLYRNDREWLYHNSPSLQITIPSIAKIHWFERDKQILEKVQQTVHTLLNAQD